MKKRFYTGNVALLCNKNQHGGLISTINKGDTRTQ